MSRPSSRNAAGRRTPVVTRSFERPEAKQTISKHLGTVLEDGLDAAQKVCTLLAADICNSLRQYAC